MIIEHKSIICPGYNAVLHIHTCIEEVEITVSFKIIGVFKTIVHTPGLKDSFIRHYSNLLLFSWIGLNLLGR